MRGHNFAIAAFIGLALVPTLGRSQTTAILRPGTSLGARPEIPANASWLGLYRTPTGYVLSSTTISIADTVDPCAGTAIHITAAGASTPEFLVVALGLRPGPVHTATGASTFLYPGQDLIWQLDPGNYYGLFAYGSAQPVTGNTLFTDYRLLIRQGQYGDTLAFPTRFTSDGHPTILWAGDLNGDRVPDFIADLTTHYEGHRFALFLSSGALGQKRLTPVAERVEPGC